MTQREHIAQKTASIKELRDYLRSNGFPLATVLFATDGKRVIGDPRWDDPAGAAQEAPSGRKLDGAATHVAGQGR